MNNMYFYLLIGVFLYILLSNYLQNFITDQENFDSSLVPISSIVSLAKIAQKMIVDNGKFIVRDNLNIGSNTNVTVTGSTIVNGSNVSPTNLSGTGASDNISPYINIGSLIIGPTNQNSNMIYGNGVDLNLTSSNRNIRTFQNNLVVDGNIETNDINIGNNGLFHMYQDTSNNYYRKVQLLNRNGFAAQKITVNSNMNIDNNLVVNGAANISGAAINLTGKLAINDITSVNNYVKELTRKLTLLETHYNSNETSMNNIKTSIANAVSDRLLLLDSSGTGRLA
jgi:hypothetical protein